MCFFAHTITLHCCRLIICNSLLTAWLPLMQTPRTPYSNQPKLGTVNMSPALSTVNWSSSVQSQVQLKLHIGVSIYILSLWHNCQAQKGASSTITYCYFVFCLHLLFLRFQILSVNRHTFTDLLISKAPYLRNIFDALSNKMHVRGF